MLLVGARHALPLIWNDGVKSFITPLSWWSMRYGTAPGLLRRYISLIYAGRNRMIICSSGAASIYDRGSAHYILMCAA